MNQNNDNKPHQQSDQSRQLLENAIHQLHNNSIEEAEANFLEIINNPLQLCYDTHICTQALEHLCTLYRKRNAYQQIITCCKNLLQIIPDHIGAHYFLGAAYQVEGKDQLALEQYTKVTELEPGHANAHLNSGVLLEKRHQYTLAAQHYKITIKLKPQAVHPYIQLGLLAFKQADYIQDGFEALLQAIKLDPDNPDVFYMLAKICEMKSQLTEAEEYLNKCQTFSPEHAQAIRLEATLLRRRGNIDEAISLLEQQSISNENEILAMEVHFELGKLYEMKQVTALAYKHYQLGNQISANLPEALHANKQAYLNLLSEIHQTFSAKWFRTWTTPYLDNNPAFSDPVFLVGFPRSGTTLLDQILSSHPNLQVIEERPMIENIARVLSSESGNYISSLANMESSRIEELRNMYFKDVLQYLDTSKTTTIIDKFPLNIIHLGLIYRLFPRTRIILALRHPCDVCLSCFMQNFGPNNAMANFYNLGDAATLYKEVMGLWRHYTNLLPVNYATVKYEDIISDIEKESRKLLDFLDLDWNPVVLDYHNKARSRKNINTPSYDQVTEKIYTRARYRWHRWKDQLAPTMVKLNEFIDYFSYH